MANTNDKVVQELFKVVQKKKEEISSAERPNWVTNCAFRYDLSSSKSVNINTIGDVNVIVEAMAQLLQRQGSHAEAMKQLNVKATPFTWFGYSVEDWKTDFKTRINKIQISSKKTELATLESRLNKLISPELRTQLELEDIAKQLS
tara:strand:+ start:143673 stop:144110 length:438 start_codon:yes stop_codon:yes gene_type:complete